MCRNCLHEVLPRRGSTCLDSGSYFLNFKECAECHTKGFPTNKKRNTQSEGEVDEDEEVTYSHRCGQCDHEIAEHFYKYELTEEGQEYLMECVLCGKGVQSILNYGTQEQDEAAGVAARNGGASGVGSENTDSLQDDDALIDDEEDDTVNAQTQQEQHNKVMGLLNTMNIEATPPPSTSEAPSSEDDDWE